MVVVKTNFASYFVNSRYNALHDFRLGKEVDILLFQLWKLEVPSKVKFMFWRLYQNRISFKDNLHRRNIQLVSNDFLCFFACIKWRVCLSSLLRMQRNLCSMVKVFNLVCVCVCVCVPGPRMTKCVCVCVDDSLYV